MYVRRKILNHEYKFKGINVYMMYKSNICAVGQQSFIWAWLIK